MEGFQLAGTEAVKRVCSPLEVECDATAWLGWKTIAPGDKECAAKLCDGQAGRWIGMRSRTDALDAVSPREKFAGNRV